MLTAVDSTPDWIAVSVKLKGRVIAVRAPRTASVKQFGEAAYDAMEKVFPGKSLSLGNQWIHVNLALTSLFANAQRGEIEGSMQTIAGFPVKMEDQC